MKTKNKHKTEKKGSKTVFNILRPIFWFFVGVSFASFCLSTFFLLYFKTTYKDKTIPGVFIGNTYVGEKTSQEIKNIFESRNRTVSKVPITFIADENTATVSAGDLEIGYDISLITKQAASIGKNADMVSNIYHIINSYLNGTYLSPSYTANTDKISKLLNPIEKKIYVAPVDALFQVQNKRVVAFKQSSDGKTIDFDKLQNELDEHTLNIISGKEKSVTLKIPIKTLKPNIPTEKANNLGIVEEIGKGTSMFPHSIPGRVYNVALAASKINGVLVAPGEEFSFVKNLGDVSQYTGYKQAYIIQNGKTVLGDGGGVCQVSTTLFRALLNAGLPITKRTAHAYRVSYYEADSAPGLDATVYYPSVDLRFKNDTGNYILIVEDTDTVNLAQTFTLYGKRDGREVTLTQPVVTNQIPAPEPSYQDDPTLPKGQIKQVDFAAAGATATFTRTVTKNGKPYIQETFTSVYRPWQAVFLRGTKEG